VPLWFLVFSVLLIPFAAAAEQRPPNVVFILADDLGWADLGCYGSTFYETPNLDRLASQSVRFTQAYAACPVCSPTRASILTGKYPARLHLTDWLPGRPDMPTQKLRRPAFTKHLALEEVTIAEALRPELTRVRDALANLGPLLDGSLMSGSGSAYFGLCRDEGAAGHAARHLGSLGLGRARAVTCGP